MSNLLGVPLAMLTRVFNKEICMEHKAKSMVDEWLLLSKRALKLLLAKPYAVEFFCHFVNGSK
jgi:hypothetical protein